MEILHVVFVDLEIAYDRVPRDLIWWVLDKISVPRGHIYIIKGVMSVRTTYGETCEFLVTTGLHQGLALCSYLFD